MDWWLDFLDGSCRCSTGPAGATMFRQQESQGVGIAISEILTCSRTRWPITQISTRGLGGRTVIRPVLVRSFDAPDC